MEQLISIATFGSGIMAGVFFIFSICIMTALKEQPTKYAIHTMQSINRIIINPLFFIVFFGTPLSAIIIIISSISSGRFEEYLYVNIASIIYILGSFGVTIVKNVPMNNKLENVDVNKDINYWGTYYIQWSFWNHIRSLSSLAAFAMFVFY